MIRIVLAGGYDTQNLGDHAMLVVLREQLEQQFGEVHITLLSRHPDEEFDRHYGVRSILNLDHESRKAAQGKWFRGLNGETDTQHLEAIGDALKEADALIIGGGRMLVDYTHGFQKGHLAYFCHLTTLARFVGVPTLLYAHSLEPLATDSGKEHLRFLATNAQGISVREEGSLEILEELEIPQDKVRLIPDPAFGLLDVPAYRGPKWPVRHPDLRDPRPILALNVRSYAWRDGDVSDFERRLAALLDQVVQETGAYIFHIPQMTYDVDSSETDDRAVARRVAERMRESASVFFAEEPLWVEEALGMYGHATALLSMRRHGMLFAATQGVPVVPLSVERNADYMAQSLGVQGTSVDLQDFEAAVAHLKSVLCDPQPLAQELRRTMEATRPAVDGYGPWIFECLQARRDILSMEKKSA